MKFAALLLLVCAAGCSTTPEARFYALSPPARTTSPQAVQTAAPGLRVGPFTFPDYLLRPNIVTRADAGRMEIAEFERWAGSIDNDLHRVLAANLAARVGTGRVSIYPADLRFVPDYVVTGEIVAFDGRLGGEVVLDAHWVIGDGKADDKTYSVQHSVVSATAAGPDYASLIAAHGQAVERLADEIATEIDRLRALP